MAFPGIEEQSPLRRLRWCRWAANSRELVWWIFCPTCSTTHLLKPSVLRSTSATSDRSCDAARREFAGRMLSRYLFGVALLWVCGGVAFAAEGLSGTSDSKSETVKFDPAKWTLVWADEFEREGAPDAGVWRPEVGYVRNKEA